MSHLHITNGQQTHLYKLMYGVRCQVTNDDTEFKTIFFQAYQKTLEFADSTLGNIGHLRRGRGPYCVQGTATAELN